MSATAGGADTSNAGARMGFGPGSVVQELGWDDDVDDELRVQIEDAIDGDMVDGDYGNVVDAVVLWWRDDDGDLVDALVDSLTDLASGGVDLAAHPQGRPAQRGRRRRRHRGRPGRRPRRDDHHGGQQGLDGHPARSPAVGRLVDPREHVSSTVRVPRARLEERPNRCA